MLNKNRIINELTNKEFIVRNAIYEHVCDLHLYDDKDINKAFIVFLQDNYNLEINYVGLIYSKLNKDIIECLIQIYFNEKDESIKEKIEDDNFYNEDGELCLALAPLKKKQQITFKR